MFTRVPCIHCFRQDIFTFSKRMSSTKFCWKRSMRMDVYTWCPLSAKPCTSCDLSYARRTLNCPTFNSPGRSYNILPLRCYRSRRKKESNSKKIYSKTHVNDRGLWHMECEQTFRVFLDCASFTLVYNMS